ncbi:MAG: hypothetical protein SWH78_12740 [Thermodesulfobacteriota bacterium]|nr:hypothetical protein [Thermodesulfobacteriota bacterium]
MDSQIQRLDKLPYLSIFSSEIEVMAGLAVECGQVETGGETYALLSQAGYPVIMLVTPPGPNAVHEWAHFRQDLEFFRKVNPLLENDFGLQYSGSWHCHHYLGIRGPSDGDVRSTHSIALRNGYRIQSQIVLTFENGYHGPPLSRGSAPFRQEPAAETDNRAVKQNTFVRLVKRRPLPPAPNAYDPAAVQIHAFLYLNAAKGKPMRCPIRVIPGMSPFREAIVKTFPELPELAKEKSFPMSRIVLDHFRQDGLVGTPSELPASLATQYLELPIQVRERAGVAFKSGFVIFSLPLPVQGGRVMVSCSNAPPYEAKAVYATSVLTANKPVELTKDVLGQASRVSLSAIYTRAVDYVRLNSRQNEQGSNFEDNRHRFRRLQLKRVKRKLPRQWKQRLSRQTCEEIQDCQP